jgi:hypothetical protein
VFDYYNANDFKLVTLDTVNDPVIVGHYTARGFRINAVASVDLDPSADHTLIVSTLGTSASVTVDGQAVVAHVFNGLLNDGAFGLVASGGSANFANFVLRSDDPAFTDASGDAASFLHEIITSGSGENLMLTETTWLPVEANVAGAVPSADSLTTGFAGLPRAVQTIKAAGGAPFHPARIELKDRATVTVERTAQAEAADIVLAEADRIVPQGSLYELFDPTDPDEHDDGTDDLGVNDAAVDQLLADLDNLDDPI